MLLEMARDMRERRAMQAFLAAEIIGDRGQIDPGLLGKETRRRALVAMGREDFDRRLDEPAASLFTPRMAGGADMGVDMLDCRSPFRGLNYVGRSTMSNDIVASHKK
jgi:hypothetical protein